MKPLQPHNPGSSQAPGSGGDNSDMLTIRAGEEITIDKAALRSFARNHHIRTMTLFGSAARGDATSRSDIDLLIEFEAGEAPSLGALVTLGDELSTLFGGHRIDVATPSILRNPFRRRAIKREARTLYAA